MNQSTFRTLVTNICATFARKQPSMESLDRWWIKVMAVPDEAIPWITDQLEERDDLPKNLPAAINGLWFRWRDLNPAKRAIEEQPKGCPYCSHGRIYYLRKSESGIWYPYTAACGHCMPATNGTYPRLTVQRIEQLGFEWTTEAKALSFCAERNAEISIAKTSSFNAVERLQAWKNGEKPDERCKTPDDDRPDIAEGW